MKLLMQHVKVPEYMQKWTQGISININIKSATLVKSRVSPISTSVVKSLLNDGIIDRTYNKRTPFRGNFFTVPKTNGSARPIINLSHLTGHIKHQRVSLRSAFQEARNQSFPKNVKFCKLDLKEAFYNIDINPKEAYKTCFEYNNARYVCNRLPMGIASAPSIAQDLLKSILEATSIKAQYIAYIDDVLLWHEDLQTLRTDIRSILAKLTQIKWQINPSKCQLEPVESISFLGLNWSQTHVSIPAKIRELIKICLEQKQITNKHVQDRVRGFINYYSQIIDPRLKEIVNQSIESKPARVLLLKLFAKYPSLRISKPREPKGNIYTDATMTHLGIINTNNVHCKAKISASKIATNELRAVLLGLQKEKSKDPPNVYCDNYNVVHLIQRGSCKWTDIGPNKLWLIFKMTQHILHTIKYIKSDQNPADIVSRLPNNYETTSLSPIRHIIRCRG